MFKSYTVFGFIAVCTILNLIGCKQRPVLAVNEIEVVGAMREVMWKGELEGKIALDTLMPSEGLYGLGPLEYLQGELLINNGKIYVSKVLSDSTMSVESSSDQKAPFFVYGWQTQWHEQELPNTVKTIGGLEDWLTSQRTRDDQPFVFKLDGVVDQAHIHIQNLPEGTEVSSPAEAHQGQTNYQMSNLAVEIIGFYSTSHKGIFTHHDSFVHLHLITKDEQLMGHLDSAVFGQMRVYLPK